MFTKLGTDITFSDVEDFCQKFGEGVRVEYKREIQHIPKTVSAFANTQGGVFIIGADTDEKTNQVIAIDGIPNSGGIEEQIQQSALTGIYPSVIPEVIIRDVPNTDNVVVIIRVDESPQAPHAIENSKKVYVRTGSITQPDDYAEIDRIEYMLKRRGDSQTTIQEIHKRTKDRIESLFSTDEPYITVVAHPVFPHRPLMSTGEIYEFIKTDNSFPFNNRETNFGTRRVAGGVCFIGSTSDIPYSELNEYGFVYRRETLYREIVSYGNEQQECLNYRQFIRTIKELIQETQSFYTECGYLGNIEITVQLQHVRMEKLGFYEQGESPSIIKFQSIERQQCWDSQVSASAQCLAQDLIDGEAFKVVDKLVEQLFWAFNFDNPTQRRKLLDRFYSRG